MSLKTELSDLAIELPLAMLRTMKGQPVDANDGRRVNKFSGSLSSYVRDPSTCPKLIAAWQDLGVALQQDIAATAREIGCAEALATVVGDLPTAETPTRRLPDPMF